MHYNVVITLKFMNNSKLSYKDAGVNIDAGNALVSAISPAAKSTHRPGVMSSLGGFAGLFDLKAAGFKDPLLVACTDGVGTKLKLGIETGIMHGLGIDLVAMCVNDLIVQGAAPLFFLDYYATSQLDNQQATAVIKSIAEGCKKANCALIGGETAEMPGMYAKGDFDLAGFCVGAVERQQIITGETIQQGDVMIGLPSSGVHSNGFSLVRKILEHSNTALSDNFNATQTFADVLLEPTKIYVKECLQAIKTGHVKGLSHITGGGLLENIPRVLPAGLGAKLNKLKTPPAIFQWLQENGDVESMEMYRVFNMGIGMVLICSAENSNEVCDLTNGYVVGDIIKGEGVVID